MLRNLRRIHRALTLGLSLYGFCQSRSADGATAASSASDSNQDCLLPDVWMHRSQPSVREIIQVDPLAALSTSLKCGLLSLLLHSRTFAVR